jgi:hypothetical protein
MNTAIVPGVEPGGIDLKHHVAGPQIGLAPGVIAPNPSAQSATMGRLTTQRTKNQKKARIRKARRQRPKHEVWVKHSRPPHRP